MGETPSHPDERWSFSAAQIPEDLFDELRAANLARWPTGGEFDLDEAAAYQRALPEHKQLGAVMRKAAAERRCLTQPRGGFGTLEMQLELMRVLDKEGLADVVPTTTDSYTRNEQWHNAQKGIDESTKAGRSLLNGLPHGELRRGHDPHADRGHRQTRHRAFRHRDAEAHLRNRLRLGLFRLSRIGDRLHHLVHQGRHPRRRHQELSVPGPAGRRSIRIAVSSCTGASRVF